MEIEKDDNQITTATPTNGKLQKQLGMSKHQFEEQIEGYSFPVLSPFGKVLSLCADLYSSQRTITEVENNLSSFVRPFMSYSTQSFSFQSDVRALAKTSVMESLGLNKNSHECLFISGENQMEPYNKLAQLFTNQIKNEKAGVKINVYVSKCSRYSEILPWFSNPQKVRIIALDTDSHGLIKQSSLVSAVLKNASKAQIQVIQFSGLTSLTRQNVDLSSFIGQIKAFRMEFPNCLFYGVIEGGNLLTSYTSSECKETIKNFDISVFSSQNLLGGLQASSFIIFEKDILEQLQSKGGHSLTREQQSIQALSTLRSGQLLQFHNREHIQERIHKECQLNSKLFYDEVQLANQRLHLISVLNKIDLLSINAYSPNGRYSLRILTESSSDFLESEERGYPVLLARHTSQLLHDLFGIIAPANTILKSPSNFKFMSTPSHLIQEYGLLPEAGFTELNSSTLNVDIHFLMSPPDIIYLVAALEQLALNGSKLIKLYNKTTLKPKSYKFPHTDLSIQSCSLFHKHPPMDENERSIQYSKQLAESIKILKQPSKYFSMNEAWTKERSIVFPLDALYSQFPTKDIVKKHKQNQEGENENSDEDEDDDDDNDDDEGDDNSSVDSSDSSLRKGQNEKSKEVVEQARNLIFAIRSNKYEGDDKKESRDSVTSDQILALARKSSVFIPQTSFQSDEEVSTPLRPSQETIDQLKKQIRSDLEQEYKFKVMKEESKSLVEQMKLRENRSKNLKAIFNFYANLHDVLDESQLLHQGENSKFSKQNNNNLNSKIDIGLSLKSAKNKNESNLQMGANKFFKFCHDFDVIGGQLDIKTLYTLFNKVAINNNSNHITRLQFIKFNEFQVLVDKMAVIYFGQSDSLYTQLDKYEQFDRFLGLDDPKLFKSKLKTEGLVNFSFIFHDKYQLFSAGPLKDKQYSEALKQINETQQKDNQKNKTEQSQTKLDSPNPKKGSVIQLSKFNSYQENKQEWLLDNSTMDIKHTFNEKDITQNDVFSEVAILSDQKSTQLIKQSSHQHSKSLFSNIFPEIGSDGQKQNNSEQKSHKKSTSQYQIQPFNITENSSKHIPLQSLIGSIHSPIKSSNHIESQSFIKKQQVLNRAKEISSMEKIRDSQRLNSFGQGVSFYGGDSNSMLTSIEQDQNSFSKKNSTSKHQIKQEQQNLTDFSPLLSRHYKSISKIVSG